MWLEGGDLWDLWDEWDGGMGRGRGDFWGGRRRDTRDHQERQGGLSPLGFAAKDAKAVKSDWDKGRAVGGSGGAEPLRDGKTLANRVLDRGGRRNGRKPNSGGRRGGDGGGVSHHLGRAWASQTLAARLKIAPPRRKRA